MKNKYFFLFILVSLLVSSTLVSAWIIPDTHSYISKEALKLAPNSPVGQVISAHYDDYIACQSLVDYSVFFYFQQGFSTIGKVYLASHNDNICLRAVELADKNDLSQLACAYGICSHEFSDSPSHNGFVPMMIERTGLVNGIVHAPSEECVNKLVSSKELLTEGQSALVNKYPVHKEFLIRVFQSDNEASSINVGLMMDAFVGEVANSNQYTVGFRGFTAVPISIHIILLLIFLSATTILVFLFRREKKGILNKISIALMIMLMLFVITLYVLYFTGTIWKAFQVATTPYCWVAPIQGYEQYINQAIANNVNFFNNGASVVLTLPDPAGQQALHNADAGNVWILWIIGLVLASLIAVFLFFNFRRKKRK